MRSASSKGLANRALWRLVSALAKSGKAAIRSRKSFVETKRSGRRKGLTSPPPPQGTVPVRDCDRFRYQDPRGAGAGRRRGIQNAGRTGPSLYRARSWDNGAKNAGAGMTFRVLWSGFLHAFGERLSLAVVRWNRFVVSLVTGSVRLGSARQAPAAGLWPHWLQRL